MIIAGYWIFNRLGLIISHAQVFGLMLFFMIGCFVCSFFLIILYGLIGYVCLKRGYSIDEFLTFIKESIDEEKEKISDKNGNI